MFNIFNYPEIIEHLKSISFIGISYHSSELYPISLLCPYCNDSHRKNQNEITHGHLHVAKHIPYFKCFLCNSSGNISKLLKSTGFNNRELISEISSLKLQLTEKNSIDSTPIFNNNIDSFRYTYPKEFDIYYRYIIEKFGTIDPFFFKLYPMFYKNSLFISYVNYDNRLSNSVKISGSEYRERFYKPYKNIYYYFQDTVLLYDCDDIIITEGASDLINMYLYGGFSKNSFYICNSGKNYASVLTYLIREFILIRRVNVHIIFDNDVYGIKHITNKISGICEINKNITLNFYQSKEKDVSDAMIFYRI